MAKLYESELDDQQISVLFKSLAKFFSKMSENEGASVFKSKGEEMIFTIRQGLLSKDMSLKV